MSNVKISALTLGSRLKGGDLVETSQVVTSVLTSLKLTGALVDPSPAMPPASPGTLDDEFDGGSLAGIWTWVNQQSTSVAFANSNIVFTVPASQSQLNSIVQAFPSAPWTVTAKLSANALFGNFQIAGIILRASGSGASRIFAWANSANFNHQYWTSASTLSASVFGLMNTLPFITQMYLQVYNDGTNFNFNYSLDGITFITLGTIGITATITPNQVGLVVYNGYSSPLLVAFDFFRQT